MSAIITKIDPRSPAEKAGLQIGETLLTCGGRAIRDVLDYKFYTYDPQLTLEVQGKDGAKRAVNLGACVSKPFKIGEGAVGESAKACDVRYPARVFAFPVRALGLAECEVFVKQLDDAPVICRFLERGTVWFVLRSLVVCGHSDLAFPSVPQSFYRRWQSQTDYFRQCESQQYHEFSRK